MVTQDQYVKEQLPVRRVGREETAELVVDFGQDVEASVDVAGDTVIVTADGEQYEIESNGGAQAFMANGVLTTEVDK